uniref:Uncharacterized protein n=1 Tax=Cafeteria roenbergensis TaxID=33653 RepID=A0A7S0K1B3_CAFRO
MPSRRYRLGDAPGASIGPPREAMDHQQLRGIAARLAADPRMRSGAGLGSARTLRAGGGLSDDHLQPDTAGGVDWDEAAGDQHADVDLAMRALGPSLPPLPAAVATRPALSGTEPREAASGGASRHTAGDHAADEPAVGSGGQSKRSAAERAAEAAALQREEADEEEMLARYPPMSTRHERSVSVAVAARGEPSLYLCGDGHLFEGSDKRRRLHSSDALWLIRQYELASARARQQALHSRVEAAKEAARLVREANVPIHLAHWERVRENWRSLRETYHFGRPGDPGPFDEGEDFKTTTSGAS